MPRFVVLCIVSMTLVAGRSNAIEITWAGGASDISLGVVEATRCTLLVHPTSEEQLPPEWRLVWVATSQSSSPIQFVQSTVARVLEPCGVWGSRDVFEATGHMSTVTFCRAADALTTAPAAYVIDVAPGTCAKLRAYGLVDSTVVDSTAVVTINGGTDSAFPPVILQVECRTEAGTTSLHALGAGLQDVSDVALVAQAAGNSAPLDIRSQSSVGLAATTLSLTTTKDVAATFLTNDGRVGIGRLAGDSVVVVPPFAQDHYIVRFLQGEVALSSRQGRTALGACSFHSTGLRDALTANGVTELEPLLPWVSPGDTLRVTASGDTVHIPDLSTIYLAHLSPAVDVVSATAVAARQAGVLYAHRDRVTTAMTSDPYYTQQWGLHNAGGGTCGNYYGYGTTYPYPTTPGYDIGAEAAWALVSGNTRVPVAVLDSGIDTTQTDLVGVAHLDTMYTSVNSTGQGGDLDGSLYHGTHVAGIIGAIRDNGIGVAGVTSVADLFAINVFMQDDYGGPPVGFTSWMAAGIGRAASRGIRLINLSGGTSTFPAEPDMDTLNVLMDVCEAAFQSGCLLVASAGNIATEPTMPPGDVSDTTFAMPSWPAKFGPQAFAVGAVLPDGRRLRDGYMSTICNYYDTGCGAANVNDYSYIIAPSVWRYRWLDVVAPGLFIVTTAQGPEGVETLDGCDCQARANRGFGGTSAAAAFVTGAAAALWSAVPDLTNEDVEHVLEATTWSQGGWSGQKGWGMIRVDEALRGVLPPRVVAHGQILAGSSGAGWLRVVDRVLGYFNVVDKHGNNHASWRVRYTLEGTAAFGAGFGSEPWVWTRARGSLGSPTGDGMNELADGYGGEVVRATADSVTLRTHVYRDQNTSSWFPADTVGAKLAWTAIGDGPLTGVAGGESRAFSLMAFPNPSWSETQVCLSLPWRGLLRVAVYDLAGRRVADLAHGMYEAGVWRFEWSGEAKAGGRAPAGVYFCRAEVNGRRLVSRMVTLGAAR